MLTDLEDKTIPKQYREKLCLVWFAHLVILVRDVNKVIEDDLLASVEDFDKFNNYPWGYDNFYLTVQYLLTELSSGTTTLYEFPWGFLVKLITNFTHPLIYIEYSYYDFFFLLSVYIF